jgi:hypothetical protein
VVITQVAHYLAASQDIK